MLRKVILVSIVLLFCSCSSAAKPTREGLVEGGMVGGEVNDRKERIEQQEEILRRQDAKIEQQKREMEDLRRQELYNQSMQQYNKN